MTTKFSFLHEMSLTEKYGTDKLDVLNHLQSSLARRRDIHVSLRSLLRLFVKPVGPEPSDWEETKKTLKREGYKIGGGWEENSVFWKDLLTKPQYDLLTTIYEMAACEDEELTELTANDYKTWMRVLRGEAKDRGINLNNKTDFTDLAFEMLDNDPKIDAMGFGGERAKRTIISVLRRQFDLESAKKRIKDSYKQVAKSAQEDEEEGVRHAALLSLKDQGKEACEKALVNQMKKGHDVETACSLVSARCPYNKDTTEHKAWMSGYNEALQQALKRQG